MGGICGVLRFDGQAAARGDLEAQVRALAHLGPDGSQLICDGPLGLGALAMQVTHEDRLEAQPLADPETSVLLVADLRLDNREELAEALDIGTTRLASLPDSAVLLEAYLRWGEDCATRLVGDFAFAIWDPRSRRLTLGRDHVGQRQVFFHRGDGFLAFATEMKGLWALPDVPRALYEPGVAVNFLRLWHRRAPGQTKFEGIRGLPAATVFVIDADGAARERRYWTQRPGEAHLGRDDAYYVEAYRTVLAEAVACRVRRTNRPCGLLLSGGFDSAAIASLAKPPAGPLIGAVSATRDPAAHGPLSARRWVELCVRDMPHLDARYVTRRGRSIFSNLERTLLSCDGQISVNRYVNDELYATVAAGGARLVMNGEGGDHSLNPRSMFAVARLLAAGRFRSFLAELAATRRATGVAWPICIWREVLRPFAPPALRHAVGRLRYGERLFGGEDPINADFAARAAANWPDAPTPTPSFRRPRVVLENVMRKARDKPTLGDSVLAAQHGLSLTWPFHDKRVVELALAIPEDLYFRNGRDRYLARTALADVLPPEFQTRASWDNTPLIPDLLQMTRENEARIVSEIERLARNPRLTAYFDFDKMRRTVRRELDRDPRRRRGAGVRHALRGLLWALHIEWFLGANAAEEADAPTS
jgi:asparagine synthase (glutamine-hydrolysing)